MTLASLTGSPLPESEWINGIEALFLQGAYRQVLIQVERAIGEHPQSGSLKLWRAITLEAMGQTAEALTWARPLMKYPDTEIAKQAKYLVSIWEAPRLRRRRDLVTEIPDLGYLSDSSWDLTSLAPTPRPSSSPSSTNREPQSGTVIGPVKQTVIGFIGILTALAGLIWLLRFIGR